MNNMRVFGVAAALVLISGTALADPIPGADFVFGSVLAGPNVFDSAEISLADATAFGSATSFASLAGGVLRVKAQPVAGAGNNGNGFARAGLGTRIFLSGPAAVAGEVYVTMSTTGIFDLGTTTIAVGQIQGSTGQRAPGAFNIGRTGDVQNFGSFVFSEGVTGGPHVTQCTHCSYTDGTIFPFETTATLPFAAGATFVDYTAQLVVGLNGSNGVIDASNSAHFSIVVPDGFTYSSALAFQNVTTPVPEPSSVALLFSGLAFSCAVMRRRKEQRQS
jgi:hypothetical protein